MGPCRTEIGRATDTGSGASPRSAEADTCSERESGPALAPRIDPFSCRVPPAGRPAPESEGSVARSSAPPAVKAAARPVSAIGAGAEMVALKDCSSPASISAGACSKTES